MLLQISTIFRRSIDPETQQFQKIVIARDVKKSPSRLREFVQDFLTALIIPSNNNANIENH